MIARLPSGREVHIYVATTPGERSTPDCPGCGPEVVGVETDAPDDLCAADEEALYRAIAEAERAAVRLRPWWAA